MQNSLFEIQELNEAHQPPLQQCKVSRSTFYHGDCLIEMDKIADKSVDMILCDLPYGYERIGWDTVIPFEPLWVQYKRIIKDNAAIVLTASQPFTSALVMSNIQMFKHEWVWDKHIPRGFQVARYRPMRKHEDVLVFGKGKINYYPLMELRDKPVTVKNYSKGNSVIELNNTGTDNESRTYSHKSPDTIIKGCWEANAGKLHTSQKPVSLMEYLIKTYTKEGDTVLDNCMGSGTTGVACKKTGRNFIGIEKDQKYFELAVRRVSEYCG